MFIEKNILSIEKMVLIGENERDWTLIFYFLMYYKVIWLWKFIL